MTAAKECRAEERCGAKETADRNQKSGRREVPEEMRCLYQDFASWDGLVGGWGRWDLFWAEKTKWRISSRNWAWRGRRGGAIGEGNGRAKAKNGLRAKTWPARQSKTAAQARVEQLPQAPPLPPTCPSP